MSEIAPKKVRGALVSGYQFCITIGILLANCVVYATKNRLGQLASAYFMLAHLLILYQTLDPIVSPLLFSSYGPSSSRLASSFCQNRQDTTSRKADSRMPPRLSDAFVAKWSNRTTFKMNLLKSLPTTSTRCKSFLSTATSSRGPNASAVASLMALPTFAVRSLVSVCR